ncbi:MAG: SMP-30/gluconolactonase/LRE family protein [Flavobacteriaceae bacterium]|nr:SMP-30/gluconolactonase/LRE family protein [Flavobacteriaceae bacterium]
MNQKHFSYLILLLIFNTSLFSQRDYPIIGSVQRLSDQINTLISPDATIQELASGFSWSEGPLWVHKLNGLIFSDVPTNKAYLWTESNGLEVFLDPSGHTDFAPSNRTAGSNGLALDIDGNLILCQHGDRRIAKLTSWDFQEPQYQTIIGTIDGKRFNSPNDLVIDSKGQIYFTDPPYGLKRQDEDELKEIEENGVYLWNRDKDVLLLDSSLTRPNGIGLGIDEKILYVANSDRDYPVILAFDISDGLLSNKRVFFDGTELSKLPQNPGNFDGLKVHSSGTVFATGPGGVLVIDPEGKHLGTIRTGKPVANCGFGPNEKYLYLTSDDILARIPLL